MYKRKKEELEKFVKKQYQQTFVDEVLGLYNEIEQQKIEIEQQKIEIEQFKHELSLLNNATITPEFKFANALKDYLHEKGLDDNSLKTKIVQCIKTAVKCMDVEVDGYYDEYSGQRDHYHKATVTLNNY